MHANGNMLTGWQLINGSWFYFDEDGYMQTGFKEIDGKTYYRIKSIKYHKNGFVSKVVYGNGNVNRYNTAGLMTSAIVKTDEGAKYTYKYTKKNGKVVKVIVRRNGELNSKTTVKYGKKSTKDVWKYSCAMSFAGCPTNAYELYAKSTLSGINY